MAGTARITSTGAIVEVTPDPQVWITAAGAYVEFRAISKAHITAMGAYIEYMTGVTPELRMRHGKGFVEGILQPYGSEI